MDGTANCLSAVSMMSVSLRLTGSVTNPKLRGVVCGRVTGAVVDGARANRMAGFVETGPTTLAPASGDGENDSRVR